MPRAALRRALLAAGVAAALAAGPAAAAGEAPPAAAAATVLPPASAPARRGPSGGEDDAPAAIGFRAAVERALARNPSMAVAREEIRRAEALVRQVRAGSLPTLGAAGVYTRLDGERTLGAPGTDSFRVIAGADQISANLTLAVPLVQPQRWAQWAHAREAVDVSRHAARDVRRQVAVATARAYLAVLAQKRVVEVDRRSRETAKAHYDYAHVRRQGGVGNRIDEVRAAQELAVTEAALEVAATGLARAREALGVLIGSSAPVDAVDEPALPEPPPPERAVDEAERRRTDVLLARARQRHAAKVLRDSWTDFLPSLTGAFQPFFQDPPSLVLPRTGWQATLSLSWQLYDGGLRYGQRRERSALLAEADALVDGALRQARADVRIAAEAVRRAERALRAARAAADLSTKALDLAGLAYRAGATTNIEVIDAERRARDAETAAVIAEDNLRQARLDLLTATGRFP